MCLRLHLTWLTALAVAHGSAAPIPKQQPDPVSYYPSKVEAKWVYSNDGTEDCVLLSAVESKGGATVLTFVTQEKGGKTAPRERLRLTDKGIFRVEVVGKAIDPPLCLLKLPAIKGVKWEESSGADGVESKTTSTVFGPEDVEVPAGRFKAIRVELEMEITLKQGVKLATPYRQTNWYVPGVGCVKQVAGEAVKELKSFTPGKD